MIGLALRGLDALNMPAEARVWAVTLEASGAKQLAKIDALESQEWELVGNIGVLSINWLC